MGTEANILASGIGRHNFCKTNYAMEERGAIAFAKPRVELLMSNAVNHTLSLSKALSCTKHLKIVVVKHVPYLLSNSNAAKSLSSKESASASIRHHIVFIYLWCHIFTIDFETKVLKTGTWDDINLLSWLQVIRFQQEEVFFFFSLNVCHGASAWEDANLAWFERSIKKMMMMSSKVKKF